jgi:hypothetical protein
MRVVVERLQGDRVFHINHIRRVPEGETPQEMLGDKRERRAREQRMGAQWPAPDELLQIYGLMECEFRDADQRVFCGIHRLLLHPVVSAAEREEGASAR